MEVGLGVMEVVPDFGSDQNAYADCSGNGRIAYYLSYSCVSRGLPGVLTLHLCM
jgi:hypothetical protein